MDSVILQVILQHVPGEFMWKLESWNDSLFFEIRELALLQNIHGKGQLMQNALVVVEAMFPTNIFGNVFILLFPLSPAVERSELSAVNGYLPEFSNYRHPAPRYLP